jgi:hypothetical protein
MVLAPMAIEFAFVRNQHFLMGGLSSTQMSVDATAQTKGIRRCCDTLILFFLCPSRCHFLNTILDSPLDFIEISLPFVEFQRFLFE